ncbi:MAG: FAD-dependent oxidoreductase [Verrucomicrobiae bacterium]|nr:FAD-dependent oxidoreductase [Verrucomicrobiae bacterium]
MSEKNERVLDLDCVVIGGGVAALWVTNLLKRLGYATVLLTNSELGAGQSLAAQGVIHSGVKYLGLGARKSAAAEELSRMPAIWGRCLGGAADPAEGQVNLDGVEVLSETQLLWGPPGLFNRIAAGIARGRLQKKAERLDRAAHPPPFDSPRYRGELYRMGEPVLDPATLIESLARGVAGLSHRVEWGANAELKGERGCVRDVRLTPAGGPAVTLRAARWVFAAGAGNGALIEQIGLPGVGMQRRPLCQVAVRAASLPPMYSVCLPFWRDGAVATLRGAEPKPAVVVTTHRDSRGRTLWYLGGQLAETGVERSDAGQIDAARQLMERLLPWVDFRRAEWSVHRVDRAEPATSGGHRPSTAFCHTHGNVTVTWPTKLALAPDLAKRVLKDLGDPGSPGAGDGLDLPLPRAVVGRPPWEVSG